MKNKRKYLSILTLVSLIWGTTDFTSYADNRTKKEVIVDKKSNQKNDKRQEAKPVRSLRKATSEEGKFSGEVFFEGAHNVGVSYPARTDFMPSLIITKKGGEKEINAFALDVMVKLGAQKKFVFEDEVFNGTLDLRATNTAVKLSQIFLTWNGWTFGIAKNNFGTIATFPGAKVTQLSWKKDINEMFNVGVGIEEAKEFSFFAKDDTGKAKAKEKKALKPRKDLPASSGRVQYNLPNKLGIIELSGLFRPLGWFSPSKETTQLLPGYGVNLGGKIDVKPETDTLTVHFLFGQGIGEYVGDLMDLASEPISVYINDGEGKVKPIMTSGAYATYEHHWTPVLRSTFGGGLTTILNEDKTDRPNAYKLGAYATGNLVYWFTEHTSVGVEYGTGYRKNADDTQQDLKQANHIKAMFEFKI